MVEAAQRFIVCKNDFVLYRDLYIPGRGNVFQREPVLQKKHRTIASKMKFSPKILWFSISTYHSNVLVNTVEVLELAEANLEIKIGHIFDPHTRRIVSVSWCLVD